MKKQNIKKISAKVFLAIFLVNIVAIFNFSQFTSATSAPLHIIYPNDIFQWDEFSISWTAIQKANDGQYIYEDYYTEIWMSEIDLSTGIWSSWNKIGIVNGLGSRSYQKTLNNYGEFKFLLKEYSSYKGYFSLTTYTYNRINGPFLVATQESEVVRVIPASNSDTIVKEDNALNLHLVNLWGNFPATYSFEQEIGASGDDITFVDVYEGSCSIVSEKSSHDAVLFIDSDSDESSVKARFGRRYTEGIVEFWWYPVDNGGNGIDNKIQFYSGYPDEDTLVGEIYCNYEQNGKLYWSDISSYIPISNQNHLNTWTHIKIQWVSSNVEISINDGGPIISSLKNGYSSIDALSIVSLDNQDCYIDAIGYSWDQDYNVGDNQNEITSVRTGDPIEVAWEVFKYSQGIITYNDYHSELYKSSDNGSTWTFVTEILGIGYQSYSVPTDSDGFWKFRVVVHTDNIHLGDPIYRDYSNGPYYIVVDDSDEAIEVKHEKFALVVAGSHLTLDSEWTDMFRNSAQNVYNVLINNLNYDPDNIEFLVDEYDADGKDWGIGHYYSSINTLAQKSRIYDEVIVFWSSHGSSFKNAIQKGGMTIIDGYINEEDLSNDIGKIKCKIMYIFIEACYSGSLMCGEKNGLQCLWKWSNYEMEWVFDSYTKNRIIFASSNWDELSWIGIFADQLSYGLRGDADIGGVEGSIGNDDSFIAMDELWEYVNYWTPIKADGSGNQHPRRWKSSEIPDYSEIIINEEYFSW